MMRVVLAQPRGFCAGVVRAIDIVERALEKTGQPVFVRHEIVHNQHVVGDLKKKGAHFVEELSEIPDGAFTVFRAHGVSQSVISEAKSRGLPVIDATCPLVSKVHSQAKRYVGHGRALILIGHRGHPEVEGTMGQSAQGMYLIEALEDVAHLQVRDPGRLSYVTQTTLSVDDAAAIVNALKARFPAITGPKKDDICYATQNRQDAVKFMAPQCDVVIVVGSPNSSNSNRLREVAQSLGTSAHMVDSAAQLQPQWIEGKRRIGVTAGASAPENLVTDVISRLYELGAKRVTQLPGRDENVVFALPKQLTNTV